MPTTKKPVAKKAAPKGLFGDSFPSRIDVHIHGDTGGQQPALAQILAGINQLIEKVQAMSAELDTLTAEVKEETDVMQSAVTLIEGLAEQIRALSNDPAALKALADSLDQGGQALAAAVAANTPAAPGGGGGDPSGEPTAGKRPAKR